MIGKCFKYVDYVLSDDRRVVSFNYQIETNEKTFKFCEKFELPNTLPNNKTVEKLLHALHIALGISYYKPFIPPEILHPYQMDKGEADFWNEVFLKGLGEFLYTNRLSPAQIAKFSSSSGQTIDNKKDEIHWKKEALLGVGGGKDSIVAGEILKELSIETTGYVLATASNRGQTRHVVEKMGIDLLSVKRYLDPQVLEINKMEETYNGHVPISLIFALTGCLLATAESKSYVVVANEASASIPTTKWQGLDVNHQWSKSLEFEKLFQSYLHKFVSVDLHYFSLIRPLSSVAVAKIFSNYEKYFEVFTSDNSLFKINPTEREHPRWSRDSPKSLSSYILLAPWMSEENLDRTFGSNFLNKAELEDLFLALVGIKGEPVLDCVGTRDELILSLSLLVEQDKHKGSYLLKLAIEKGILLSNTSEALATALSLSQEQSLPSEIKQKIITQLEAKLS